MTVCGCARALGRAVKELGAPCGAGVTARTDGENDASMGVAARPCGPDFDLVLDSELDVYLDWDLDLDFDLYLELELKLDLDLHLNLDSDSNSDLDLKECGG